MSLLPLTLLKAGFRQQSTYRLAMLAGFFTNSVFGLIRGSVLIGAYESSDGGFGGYTRQSLIAYVWLSQALLGSIVLMSAGGDLRDRILSGDVAVDFLRPMRVLDSYLWPAVGRAVYTLLPRGVPALVVGTLTFGWFLPTDLAPYLLGLPSLAIAIAASYLSVHCVALLGMVLVDTRGIQIFYGVLATFLAGLYVPVSIFPEWLRILAALTPFPTFLQYPVDVLGGRVTGATAWQHLAVQAAWLVVLVALAVLLERAGRRRMEVQGG